MGSPLASLLVPAVGWAGPSLVPQLTAPSLGGISKLSLPACLGKEGEAVPAPPVPPCSLSAGCSQPGCSAGGHRGSRAVPPPGRSLIHGEFGGVGERDKGPPCPHFRPRSLCAKPWGAGQPDGCWGWRMAFVGCRGWHHPLYPYGNS